MNPAELQRIYESFNTPEFNESLSDPFLKQLITIMTKAGTYALSMRQNLNVQLKGQEDFVTTVDLNNQDYLVSELLKFNFQEMLEVSQPPRVGFVIEEDTEFTKSNRALGDEDILIYIDPIDGTTAFKDHKDSFAIGISIEERTGSPLYAVTYMPARGEAVVVDRDHNLPFIVDAQGNIREISEPAEKPASLDKIAAHYNLAHKDKQLKLYSFLAGREVKWPPDFPNEPKFGDNPVPGSLMEDLCDLSMGKYDLLINGGAYPWDVASAKHVLDRLGFEILDWSGQKLDIPSLRGKDKILTIVAGRPENVRLFFQRVKDLGIDLAA